MTRQLSQCLRTDVPIFGFKEPAGSEKQEQMLLFGEIERYAPQHNLLNFIFHTPNGERRARKTAYDLSKMGVRPGVWDVLYPAPLTIYGESKHHWKGLAIEMKVAYNPLSTHQVEWMFWYQHFGWYTAVCYTWQWAWRVVCSYFGLTMWDYKAGLTQNQLEMLP